ncbi:diaminopropionate ammonia-lyase [Candidimonas nitroreducens]|uniref:Diaminopropionate ammonia-lyase n=1 Tax=Candidimonas nitroreducens TaxID=683354 RepID=A0A225N4C5_9BURK|nr:diaminopropionate ammonia-lyase [Candidimonas nitroreducens]OWT65869.1 diaminopropionate ammonia-lyase [Candidimonas nitroreducens]
MLSANKHAARVPYPESLRSIMSIRCAEQSRQWLSQWRGIAHGATPLRALPGLAARLGIAWLGVKDESQRSPLGSFKALGAPVALLRQVLRLHPGFEPEAVLAGRYAGTLKDYTVISATDGNHGRALAAAARDAGCRCVIVLHAQVSVERERAIADCGARIVRIAGNYDASVAEAARLAAAHGWQVVSDTSYEGYEDIPRDVMQGYGVIASELVEQADGAAGDPPYTHVFLQGGVGGLAAGIVSYLWEKYGARRPRFIVVEPVQADCLYQSALAGRPAGATGTVDSIMAGLACGEASPLAWRFLQDSVDDFMTITDDAAIEAMRTLAAGDCGDVPIVSGESGAAGLAGLLVLLRDRALAGAAGLNAASRALLISTEGATAPLVYEQCVGVPAASVLSRQQKWRASVDTAGISGCRAKTAC